MSEKTLTNQLSTLLADTYALYLKTQNYHWHVSGENFKTLHELFEEQYKMLAEAVDEIAERLLTLGEKAPATFSAFNELKSLKDGNSGASAREMVKELHDDHGKVIEDIRKALLVAQELNDEGTVSLLSDRIAEHEKTRWMLGASY